VDVEKPTGKDRPNADDGARDRPDPRAENDSLGTDGDVVRFSQPGRDITLSCPGCRKAPGVGEKFALSGPTKGPLREFVQRLFGSLILI
jgi:hypothetical protein